MAETRKLSTLREEAITKISEKLFDETDRTKAKNSISYIAGNDIDENIKFNTLQKAGVHNDLAFEGRNYSIEPFIEHVSSAVKDAYKSVGRSAQIPADKDIKAAILEILPQENPIKNRNKTVALSSLTDNFINTFNSSVFTKDELKTPLENTIVEDELKKILKEGVSGHIQHNVLGNAGVENDYFKLHNGRDHVSYSNDGFYDDVIKEVKKVADALEKKQRQDEVEVTVKKPESPELRETLRLLTSKAVELDTGTGLPGRK